MEVTFIICNYNDGEYIKECVESAFLQDYHCNICIIDDCSTDDSVEIVKKMFAWTSQTENNNCIIYEGLKNDKKITLVVKKENSGPSISRNIGIELTKDYTDIYAILDADDAALNNKISTLLPYFDDEYVGVVYADYFIKNVETGIITREYKKAFCKNKLLYECIVHSGSLIRSILLDKIKDENGYYDEQLRVCEDYDLWLRLSNHCIIMHHAEPLTLVRVTPNNSTNTVDDSIWQKNMTRVKQKCLR